MPNNIYNINYKKLIKWFTPDPLRKLIWLVFNGVCVTPVVMIYNTFLLYRKAKIYDLMITEQVCYIEAMLNDRYDNTLRRIYTEDGQKATPLYLYEDSELHPVYLYQDSEAQPVYLYTDGEGGDYGNDFVIKIPVSVTFSLIELRGLVDRKRLRGKRYVVQTF